MKDNTLMVLMVTWDYPNSLHLLKYFHIRKMVGCNQNHIERIF